MPSFPILTPREHLAEPFLHLGTTLGGNFSVSGAPWEAILAPRDHPGGPWEQQDGREVTNNMIFADFGLIFELVRQFWETKMLKQCVFCLAWFQVILLKISASKFRRLGLPNRGFHMESTAKIIFSWKSFLVNFVMGF